MMGIEESQRSSRWGKTQTAVVVGGAAERAGEGDEDSHRFDGAWLPAW
jgi:hypothetical protein